MVTAKDIAAELGVAVSTVGRALADDSRISIETKERVRKAAGKLGYVGNTPARVMRGASSRLVGLIVPDIMNDFYATIAQELSRHCDAHGYQIALSMNNDEAESELKRVRELIASRVAGIVIVPTATPKAETRRLLSGVQHVQLLRRVASLKSDWFGIEDETALFDATRYVIGQGHRLIAYVGGIEALPTGRDRLAGFQNAHRAANEAPRKSFLSLGPPTTRFGYDATIALMRRRLPPTAIVFGSVQATLGGVQALEATGLTMPNDVSIMGFGDPVWFQWSGPGLTTMRLPMQELAQMCSLRFLERLERRRAGNAREALLTEARPATLVERGSIRRM